MYKILIAIIFTEAITELIVKSEFFYPVRKFFFESSSNILKFIHKIIDCGYCFSVWSAIFTFIMFYIINNLYFNYFIYCIVLHRLSNLFHFTIDRFNKNNN